MLLLASRLLKADKGKGVNPAKGLKGKEKLDSTLGFSAEIRRWYGLLATLKLVTATLPPVKLILPAISHASAFSVFPYNNIGEIQ